MTPYFTQTYFIVLKQKTVEKLAMKLLSRKLSQPIWVRENTAGSTTTDLATFQYICGGVCQTTQNNFCYETIKI